MIGVLALLLMPACATVAGLVVGVAHRHEALDDGALLRNFLIILVIGMTAAWGIGRTDAVQMRLYPQLRMQTDLNAHPVYVALQRAPDDAKALQQTLVPSLSAGATLSEAFLQARPVLTALTTQRMGFADQESRLMWGHVIADSLRELQAQDPALCYRALSGQARDPQALSHAFTADNTQAFQRAVVRIYESADEGLRHQRAAGDKPANFNETALEYRAIQNSVEQSFGPSVAAQISSRKFPESPADSPGQICAARIYQLEAMMERPKPAAAMLIDSALR